METIGNSTQFKAHGTSSIAGASLSAAGGTIALPGITQYTASNSALWSASNGGVLDLSNIIDVDLGPNSTVDLQIDAKSGGRIDLRNVNKISDAATFGRRRTMVSADGLGSSIDLSSLTQFEENSSGLGASSSISVTNSGSIAAPSLTSLKNVYVTLNSQGSLPYAQWTKWVGGGGTFTAGTYNFPNLIDISGTSLSAGAGATVSVPLITRHLATGSATWSASNGGILDLSNIVDIDLGSNSTVELQIDARAVAVSTCAMSIRSAMKQPSVDVVRWYLPMVSVVVSI